MGLAVRHDSAAKTPGWDIYAFHGSYGTFQTWRAFLERYDSGAEDYATLTLRNPWAPLDGTDPLIGLLMHSDCDGTIPSAVCPALAERLETICGKITPEWTADAGYDDSDDDLGAMREITAQFVVGCRAAAAAGEDLHFC